MTTQITLFDFDGTITSKDTLIELIKFQKGIYLFCTGIVFLSPVILLFKLGVIPNWKAKEILLTYFFEGTPIDHFQDKCDQFSQYVLPKLIRPQALEQIENFKKNDVRIVIVTASADNWVSGWCKRMDIECIASCLEVTDGKITGKLNGKNCHGVEKVVRINAAIDLSRYDTIYAFGDSEGDVPMLELGTKQFYKPFR